MLRLLVAVLAIYGLHAFITRDDGPEKAALVSYAAERTEAQDKILVDLLAMKHPVVDDFVDDWRKAFPQPSPQQLTRLKVSAQNIKNDPGVAMRYTLSWKRINEFCDALGSTSGSNSCDPGV